MLELLFVNLKEGILSVRANQSKEITNEKVEQSCNSIDNCKICEIKG